MKPNNDKRLPVYITEAQCLLITEKIGRKWCYGDEYTQQGREPVQWATGDNEKDLVMAQAIPVFAVVDKDNQILTDQRSFYFNKDFAKAVTKEMNAHVSQPEKKPFTVIKAHLLLPVDPEQ